MGPVVYVRHLTSGPRLPFTVAYFASIALTIYFSVGVSVCTLSDFFPFVVTPDGHGNR